MFVLFDYRCPDCGFTEERFVRREEMDDQWHYECCVDPAIEDDDERHEYLSELGHMTRLPAGTRTTFRFADTRLKD